MMCCNKHRCVHTFMYISVHLLLASIRGTDTKTMLITFCALISAMPCPVKMDVGPNTAVGKKHLIKCFDLELSIRLLTSCVGVAR